jgi:hypothetical protein
LNSLAQLLDSKADEISPLSGYELIASKVEKLVSMAVTDFRLDTRLSTGAYISNRQSMSYTTGQHPLLYLRVGMTY